MSDNFFIFYFFENSAFCEIMWKNVLQPGRPQRPAFPITKRSQLMLLREVNFILRIIQNTYTGHVETTQLSMFVVGA
jgi:hypothetical protein